MTDYVYVMEFPDGYHKIGISLNPEQRMRSLKNYGPYSYSAIRICAQYETSNPLMVEGGAHRSLAFCRLKGTELFKCSEDTAKLAVQFSMSCYKDNLSAPNEVFSIKQREKVSLQPEPLYKVSGKKELRVWGLTKDGSVTENIMKFVEPQHVKSQGDLDKIIRYWREGDDVVVDGAYPTFRQSIEMQNKGIGWVDVDYLLDA